MLRVDAKRKLSGSLRSGEFKVNHGVVPQKCLRARVARRIVANKRFGCAKGSAWRWRSLSALVDRCADDPMLGLGEGMMIANTCNVAAFRYVSERKNNFERHSRVKQFASMGQMICIRNKVVHNHQSINQSPPLSISGLVSKQTPKKEQQTAKGLLQYQD